MLKLPSSIRMAELPVLWPQLQASLRAEAAQVGSAAGHVVRLDVGDLHDFDSGALTLLLSAARLLEQQGLQLQLSQVPVKLQELARVYGVDEVLWRTSNGTSGTNSASAAQAA
ncbi:STAS domain-containing protein [Pelomonas sp. V22]|uniref:STAS domain-containing protein n=1 Tax=Pelomonas sp. V22 TaxID=2822139 RepID=UPI0024A860D8|nr:STAS domain-containing protein [Pelomonas sp. V22]MDI4632682.1 STAS domain-containing protein [Pelomonas sp. V22]